MPFPVNTIDGLFHDGDPGSNTPGTVVDAEWLNAVQDAILNIAGTVRVVDNTYPIVNSDAVILCDTTVAGFTVTLPAVAGLGSGKRFCVKNRVGGIDNISLVATDGKTMDGVLQLDLAPGDKVWLCHDGDNWETI